MPAAIYTHEEEPSIDAFRNYMGGGFTGLITQEIREYRSLAYATFGWYLIPPVQHKKAKFFADIGTQADKSNDAIKVMYDLLTNMPEKPERMEMIKQGLIEEAPSKYPNFRLLPQSIENHQIRGYEDDPNKIKQEKYQQLSFSDITEFYKKHIQNKPMIIAIAGDKRKIDLDALSKFGELTVVSKKDIIKQ